MYFNSIYIIDLLLLYVHACARVCTCMCTRVWVGEREWVSEFGNRFNMCKCEESKIYICIWRNTDSMAIVNMNLFINA